MRSLMMVIHTLLLTIGVSIKCLGLHKLHYDAVITMNHSDKDVRIIIVEDEVKGGIVKHDE